MTRKSISLLGVAMATALAAVSCIDDKNNGGGTVSPDNTFYNFATYNGSTESGSSFTIVREGDASSATLTFTNTFKPEQIKSGNRVFMAYTTASGQEFASGAGTLYSVSNVTGDPIVKATEKNDTKYSTPIKLTQMKRTGDFLNIVFQIPSNGSLKTLQLTQKENTKNPAMPILGLYVKSDSETADYRYARVSFDVKSVLAPADVEGFRVAYFGERSMDTLNFVKNNGSGTIKPIE